ncbi:MAG: ZIP family metal transporter [Bryobacterales bacterium]|nr:ZIP family metal transporter [Bryobacterales bacterium]
MSPFTIKIWATVAILAAGVIGGLIPILATRRSAGDRFLSLGNALAGGTFLGAGFLHLLPEAAEVLDEVFEYPLGPLLTVTGVCLLLLIDRVLFELFRPISAGASKLGHKPHHHLILLVVLSIHAAIAGIAVGLETETATLLLLAGAILCHKGAASFALVVCTLSALNDTKKVVGALGVFAAMTPVGIVLGVSSSVFLSERSSLIFEGSFNALAAGTFIYIAILDIIDDELSSIDDRIAKFTRSALGGTDDHPMPQRDPDRVVKFLLILVGVAAMALMRFFE